MLVMSDTICIHLKAYICAELDTVELVLVTCINSAHIITSLTIELINKAVNPCMGQRGGFKKC